MRKLMWFTIGFAASCGLCAYGLRQQWMLPLGIFALILLAGSILVGRKWKVIRPLASVSLGCVLGLMWFGAFTHWYLSPVESLDGQTLPLEFTASDYSRETDYGVSADGILKVGNHSYQIRAYLEEGTIRSPGDRVKSNFRIRLTTLDAWESSRYHQGEGVFLLLYQQEEITVEFASEVPSRFLPSVLRRQISDLLKDTFPEDTYPFVKALLLGDSSNLDYETDSAFKVSGIRHIIAVSGLHISILYALISLVTLRKRFLTALVGIPVLFLFAAVAGFSPSAIRACIMVFLMLLARIFDREYDPPNALAFAVLTMAVINPLVVTSVSLQLSALCIAGILLFNAPINSWLKSMIPEWKPARKLRGFFCSSISVTLSAMSLVTPLCAYYFGMVSLIGVFTNLLTLWVVNLIFNGLVVVCLLYPLIPTVARLLAWVLACPVRYVLWTAKTMASAPLSAVYTDSIYIVFWLVFTYILLAVFLISRKKQPAVILCCVSLGLCFALIASWCEGWFSDTRITMLDVGQGQSILLEHWGKAFLVDCGGDDDEKTADIIAGTLLSRGISHLDGIILTHYDRDHSGALANLLTRVDTSLLFLPDTRNDFTLPETDAGIVYVWEDLELSFGDANMAIYGPVYSGNDNENSLCVLFDTEKCDILITGDRSDFGEWMLLHRRNLPDVDILVAGHHGAASSTSEELLNCVTPEIVLISVEQDNIYGHPAPQLLQRLARFGCAVYRTDELGTITIRR